MAGRYKPRIRQGFVILHDDYDVLISLPEAERLALIDAMAAYSKAEADGKEWTEPNFSQHLAITWKFLKRSVDNSIQNYEAKRHKGDEDKPPGEGETSTNMIDHVEDVPTCTNMIDHVEQKKKTLIKTLKEKDEDLQGRSARGADLAEAYTAAGLKYDNFGRGGTLKGAIAHELDNGATEEQILTAIQLVAAEMRKRPRKKLRDPWGYFLTALAGVEEECRQQWK